MNRPPGSRPTRSSRWRRWALLPPLLLLLIGFGVLAYRVSQPDWRGLEARLSRGPAVSPLPPTALPEPSPPETPDDPESADVEPARPYTSPLSRGLALASNLSRLAASRLRNLEIPPFLPQLVDPQQPPRQALDLQEALKPVDPAQVWNEIRREAALRSQERSALESLKSQLLEEDLREARQRQAAQTAHRKAVVAEQNQVFRNQLAALVSDRKVAEIRRLASLPAARPRPRTINGDPGTSRAQTLSRSRELRLAWVAQLRLDGHQDSAILAELLEAHRLNRIARNGPRTDDDAVVRAAIDLLAVPAGAHPDQMQQALLAPRSGSSYSPSSYNPTHDARPHYGVSRRR